MTKLTGHIVVPGDPSYPLARRESNLRFNKFPCIIVFCRNVEDVINAVKWSRERSVKFRIRSGRHSYEGFSVLNGGLIIDVSLMNKMFINKKEGWTVVETGTRLGKFYQTLASQGVIVPAGTDPTVGIGGLALGGGIGLLTRKLGLTIDHLIGVEMVQAKGKKGAEVIWANKTKNSDLLWASRGGGGGNFGVATKYVFKTNPICDVSIYKVQWKWNQLEKVFQNWQSWAPFITKDLTSTIRLHSKQDGYITSTGQFLGSPKKLRELLKPLLKNTTPFEITIDKVPFLEAVDFFEEHDQYDIPRSKTSGAYVDKILPKTAIKIIKTFLANTPNKYAMVWSQSLGGAVRNVAPHQSAYVHRNAIFPLEFVTKWPEPSKREEIKNTKWVELFRKSMLSYTNGTYVNWVDCAIKNYAEAYYGSNYPKLQQIKAKYDPHNVFNFPQSIKFS